jgi:hypothetical protein
LLTALPCKPRKTLLKLCYTFSESSLNLAETCLKPSLRHTFASLMLLRGAKPKVISEALGHSSVAFTMDVYSHIIEGMQQDAMALLDEVLPISKNGAFQKNNAILTPKVDIMVAKA